MKTTLPEYFAIQQTNHPLWKPYIKWLGKKVNRTWLKGTNTASYYGIMPDNNYITPTLPTKETTLLFLEEWDNIINPLKVIKGHYYYAEEDNFNIIFLAKEDGNLDTDYKFRALSYCINPDVSHFMKDKYICYKDDKRTFRYATEEEIKWLDACIEANKFISKEDALKEKQYTLEDLKNGKVYINYSSSSNRDLNKLKEVLKAVFPTDLGVPNGNADCYGKANTTNRWTGSSYMGFPSFPIDYFYQQLPKQKTIKDYTITPEQAQSIIDIACYDWKALLFKEWGKNIVLKTPINVSSYFYKKMRNACTEEQHILFNTIFDEKVEEIKEWEEPSFLISPNVESIDEEITVLMLRMRSWAKFYNDVDNWKADWNDTTQTKYGIVCSFIHFISTIRSIYNEFLFQISVSSKERAMQMLNYFKEDIIKIIPHL